MYSIPLSVNVNTPHVENPHANRTTVGAENVGTPEITFAAQYSDYEFRKPREKTIMYNCLHQ